MRRAKKDNNHNEIKRDLEELGFFCEDTHRQGDGCPDMFVSGLHRGFDAYVGLMVEIKGKRGKLTPAEEAFFERVNDRHAAIIARSAKDVLEWFEWEVII